MSVVGSGRLPRGVCAYRVVTLLLFAALAGAAQAEGPLDASVLASRSSYILDLPFLHFEALTGAVPAPGELRWRLSSLYSNTFSHTYHAYAIKLELETIGTTFSLAEAEIEHGRHYYQTIIFMDVEVLRTAAIAEIGLARDFSLALEVPYLSFSAVSADGAILAFHRAFGLTQAQRAEFPTGAFLVVLQAPYGPLFYDNRRPTDGIGDLVLTPKWRHAIGSAFGVSVDLALKLPTGAAQEFRGSGSVDVGVMAGLTATWGRQSWFLQAGEVVPGRWNGPVPYQAAPFARFLGGTERRLGARGGTQVSFCVTLEESPLKREGAQAISQPAVEAVFGIVRSLGSWGSVDLTVNEHLPRFGDGTDVGVRLGLRLALPTRASRPPPGS